MNRTRRAVFRLVTTLLVLAPSLGAQVAAAVPFGVGEKFDYEFKVGALGAEFHAGTGVMQIAGVDSVRSHAAWHIDFTVTGRVLLFHVNDRYESWLDTHDIATLRYTQDIHEGSKNATHRFLIFPDTREFSEDGDVPAPSVSHPLDDGSFIYFVRTLDLRAGLDTSFDDYFKPKSNPVRIHVLRREKLELNGFSCSAIVVQPVINTTGLFSKGGEAQVWFSDDPNHVLLQMKAKVPGFPGGRLNLYLARYRLAGADSTRRTPACAARK